MEAIRSAFRTCGNVAPIEDEVIENYLPVFSISTSVWFLKEPFDFELEIPNDILKIDFKRENTTAIISKNAATPNGTMFEVDNEVYVDPDLVAVNIARTMEFEELSVFARLQLGNAIGECLLEIEILEKDPEREEMYHPYSVYAEVCDHDSKPVLRRFASLFKHIEL